MPQCWATWLSKQVKAMLTHFIAECDLQWGTVGFGPPNAKIIILECFLNTLGFIEASTNLPFQLLALFPKNKTLIPRKLGHPQVFLWKSWASHNLVITSQYFHIFHVSNMSTISSIVGKIEQGQIMEGEASSLRAKVIFIAINTKPRTETIL